MQPAEQKHECETLEKSNSQKEFRCRHLNASRAPSAVSAMKPRLGNLISLSWFGLLAHVMCEPAVMHKWLSRLKIFIWFPSFLNRGTFFSSNGGWHTVSFHPPCISSIQQKALRVSSPLLFFCAIKLVRGFFQFQVQLFVQKQCKKLWKDGTRIAVNSHLHFSQACSSAEVKEDGKGRLSHTPTTGRLCKCWEWGMCAAFFCHEGNVKRNDLNTH